MANPSMIITVNHLAEKVQQIFSTTSDVKQMQN